MSQSMHLKPSEGPLYTFNNTYYFKFITGILVTRDGQLLLSGDQHLLLLHPDRTKAEKIHWMAGQASCLTWAGKDTFAFVDMGCFFYSNVFRARIGKRGIKIIGQFRTDRCCTRIAYIDNHFILGLIRSRLLFLKIVDEDGKVKQLIGEDNIPLPRVLSVPPHEMFIDSQYRVYVAYIGSPTIVYIQLNKITFQMETIATNELEDKISSMSNFNDDFIICATMSGKFIQLRKADFKLNKVEASDGSQFQIEVQKNSIKIYCHGKSLLVARNTSKCETRIDVFDASLSQKE